MHRLTRNARRARKRGRRLDRTAAALLVCLLLAVVGALLAIAAVHIDTRPVAVSTAPAGPEYTNAQMENAAAVIAAGRVDHVPERGIEIAVMTAMGESSLLNLEHGDEAGPDSVGLFQQRDVWGPRAVRLDPVASAHRFYTQLLAIPNWDQRTPTEAAHAVQINADPDHYTPYWERAVALVRAIETEHPDLIDRYG